MPARVHPGAPRHVWDHVVIELREGEERTAFASLYDIRWSAEIGPGVICFLSTPEGTLTFADDVALGERMQHRLAGLGPSPFDLRSPVLESSVSRASTRESVEYRLYAREHVAVLTWRGLTAPFWVEGHAPGFTPAEDIWALFLEAAEPSIVLDGVVLPGQPFADPAWVPKLGRPLLSAHLALAEVRVTPPGAPSVPGSTRRGPEPRSG